jgi:hypothetical protein
LRPTFQSLRKTSNDFFQELSADPKREGISILSKNNKKTIDKFISDLEEYGAFIVEDGELEKWLPYLDVKNRKEDWLVAMFTRLKSDPNDVEYVKPSDGDVWDFIGKINNWITKN